MEPEDIFLTLIDDDPSDFSADDGCHDMDLGKCSACGWKGSLSGLDWDWEDDGWGSYGRYQV